jgi:hypothetical protein
MYRSFKIKGDYSLHFVVFLQEILTKLGYTKLVIDVSHLESP